MVAGSVAADLEVDGLRVLVQDRGPEAHWLPVCVVIPVESEASVTIASVLVSGTRQRTKHRP